MALAVLTDPAHKICYPVPSETRLREGLDNRPNATFMYPQKPLFSGLSGLIKLPYARRSRID
jgi:hypothetical protein